MRLDQYLVQIGKVRSRTQAKEIIIGGRVMIRKNNSWLKVDKPNYQCDKGLELKIEEEDRLDWVARSGEKLNGAIVKLALNFKSQVCLDVGQSTGGFTQALLKYGAEKVIGVDVGKGQLSDVIRSNPRVECFESTDARDLNLVISGREVDFFVADVSFISVLKILPSVQKSVDKSVCGLVLIKPQFEVGKDLVQKGGLVQSPSIHLDCQKQVFDDLTNMGIEALDYFPSELKGRDGNQEFFCFIKL